MSLSLQEVLKALKQLSFDELLTVQEQITTQLCYRNSAKGKEQTKGLRAIVVPPPSQEEIEAELREFLGDDYEEAMAFDLDKLPAGGKPLSQIVNENREDRL